MNLAWAKKVRLTKQTQPAEQASVRIVLLAAVSFFLGVAATALWFHFAQTPRAGQPGSQANAPSPAPAARPSAAAPLVEKPPPSSPATLAAVKRALPNYASLTVEQGTDILRQAALKKFASAAEEMQAQVAQAQVELSEAKKSKSADDQQAALKHLRQVHSEQTQKLQEIAAQLQLQLAALQELKSATNAAK